MAGSGLAQSPASPVIDGDTVRDNGVAVHLSGIDAPESGQTCSDGWQAGKMPADCLVGLIHNRGLGCDLKQSPSTPGKAYALCNVDGQDLCGAMAEAGMAWSYTPPIREYTVQESKAMIGVFGSHAHDCMKAWEWQTRQLPPRS